MKKTVVRIEGKITNDYYYGTLADIVRKNPDFELAKVIASATVNEDEEYPELFKI